MLTIDKACQYKLSAHGGNITSSCSKKTLTSCKSFIWVLTKYTLVLTQAIKQLQQDDPDQNNSS